jgi:NhaA family Na+:H+ antiporter
VFAAVGGMLIPLFIFTAYNFGSSGQSGVGIPMATDIAFALGILSLLGNRIPLSLKIFLTAFAVIDDLGAILIIAFFYTKSLSVNHLIISILIFFVLIFLNRRKVSLLLVYIIGGILMWYFMYKSGVHATIAGVLLAFAIPFQSNSESSPSKRLLRLLHKPVAFLILPLFALANTAIVININDVVNTLTQPLSKGIFFGLVIGKPLGILLFSIIGLKIGICKLPSDLNWKSILGAGFLGGIGFTMSIFITLLAFGDELVITQSKIIILMSSLVSGLMGLLFLKTIYNKTSKML